VARVQSFSFDSSIDSHEIYRPLIAGATRSQMQYIALRTNGRASINALRSQIRQIDPDLAVDIRTIDDIYRGTLTQPVFQATLFGGFALLTVLLAVAGVYAVVAYEANQRTREIGIRVALGATRADVIRQVMRGAILPAAVGVVFGLVASALLTKFMASMLYGIQPTDAVTFLVGALILLAATGTAGFLPARKASHVDPMVALRTE
jgi:ABC-type antimicrobial peptide transport system permease subunit